MNIGFIGAGKVGFSIGKYFSLKGLSLKGFYSTNYSSALDAAKFTGSFAYKYIEDLVKNTNIILITTPDDKILDAWNSIKDLDLKDKIICHCSGSLSSKIFLNSNKSGAYFYSIHPIYAFSDKYNSYKNLNSAYFSIEGDKKFLDSIENFLKSLGNKVITLDENSKKLYHLSCVTVSNLVLSLLNIGCDYLRDTGLKEEEAFEALFPLIENNLNNIKSYGFLNSLTGPAVRGDLNTLKKHIDVIPLYHLGLYKILSNNLISLAEKKFSGKDYSNLKNFLGGVE